MDFWVRIGKDCDNNNKKKPLASQEICQPVSEKKRFSQNLPGLLFLEA
jgi:hypothetical protein